MPKQSAEQVKAAVRERYASRIKARRRDAETIPLTSAGSSCCGPSSAPAEQDERSAWTQEIYSAQERGSVGEAIAELSMGCGNPVAIAELREGETVLDLGSGGGLDCFLAAQKVGPKGRAIGVDMTPEMIETARANIAKVGAANVEFRLGDLEKLPVDSANVDVIISNCVINLTPDKDVVLREAFRVLKPGGRFRVSDIVWTREPSREEQRSLSDWAGCVAGALTANDFLAKLRAAGFVNPRVQRGDDGGQGWVSALIWAEKPEPAPPQASERLGCC